MQNIILLFLVFFVFTISLSFSVFSFSYLSAVYLLNLLNNALYRLMVSFIDTC
ncbi:hypothetical protein FEM08_03700 [Flavobacterium gilvum]|nr:hypothetical protein FEM08_03700 [Flavobacterium gilvum]